MTDANPDIFSLIDQGDLERIQKIPKDADCFYTQKNDFSPLNYALWKQKYQIAKYFVDHEINLHSVAGGMGNALSIAALYEQDDLVKQLVDKGVDPNVLDSSGFNALLCAISEVIQLDTIRCLLDAGARTDVFDYSRGVSPLMVAIECERLDILELLLQHGADPNYRDDENGDSALIWALTEPNALAAVKLLLKYGASKTLCDFSGRAAFQYTKQGSELFELLKP